jgi:hypothetical protein
VLRPAGTLTGFGAGVGRSPQQKIGPIGNGPFVGVFVIAVGGLGVNVGAGESTKSGGTNTGMSSVLGS